MLDTHTIVKFRGLLSTVREGLAQFQGVIVLRGRQDLLEAGVVGKSPSDGNGKRDPVEARRLRQSIP